MRNDRLDEQVVENEQVSQASSAGADSGELQPESSVAAFAQEAGRGSTANAFWVSAVSAIVALLLLIPTIGDPGMTWDEPAYRYSQVMSAQWWSKLGEARSVQDLDRLMDPDALLYFWPYGRHGINFHPPLAGQLNLATYATFGRWMKDIPARRMASAFEFALTIAIGCHFLSKRYGVWTGISMAAALLFMPRLFGQAHLIDTDIPGLLLWAATALAFWNGLREDAGGGWRILVGILLGLAFVEKMAAVTVLLPLLLWLMATRLPRSFRRGDRRRDWIDGAITIGSMLVPLGLAFLEIQSLQRQFPPPNRTDLLAVRPVSDWSGLILAVPLMIWCVRRLLGWIFRKSPLWGKTRPGLETFASILAFAPVVGWLGNPAWWRETLPRLAHYYTLNTNRRGSLPDIQILYFGQAYQYSLPWPNAWVLIGITVPAGILIAAGIGLLWTIPRLRRDLIPVYFLLHFLTLPVLRMLPTPAHDGVRLFLPSFFFLAAFAGWGVVAVSDGIVRLLRVPRPIVQTIALVAAVGPAAYQMARIHPYELSYYNELIGDPRGAWNRGFELTYWFDAFTDRVLDDLNQAFPPNAQVDLLNDMNITMVFSEHQSLGHIRPDIELAARDPNQFPFVWMMTQDSKSSSLTRLIFALHPWYADNPPQLDGLRAVTVGHPDTVARAFAIQLFMDVPDRSGPDPPAAPGWIRRFAPFLARLWGDGLEKVRKLSVNQGVLDWARSSPSEFLEAAKTLSSTDGVPEDSDARRLYRLVTDFPEKSTAEYKHMLLGRLRSIRPESITEAARIIAERPDDVVKVMTRYGYTDHSSIGGYLDRDLPIGRPTAAASKSTVSEEP